MLLPPALNRFVFNSDGRATLERRRPNVLLPTSPPSCFLEGMIGLRRVPFCFEFSGALIIHFSDE